MGLAADPSPGSVVVSVIGGMAGIGKTALAVHVAHLLAPRFPGGCLYADLHAHTLGQSPSPTIQVLEGFLRALGAPSDGISADVDERAATFRSLVARKATLIVLDNVAEESQVRLLLPGGRGCMTLITSRKRLAGLDAARVDLDAMSPADAHELLVAGLGRPRVAAEPAQARRLAELCAHLPLALQIAAARLIARPAWTIAHLISRLEDEGRRLDEFTGGDRAVRAALDLSYRELMPEQGRLFRRLGLYPTKDISVFGSAIISGVNPADAAALASTGEIESILESLVDAHLIDQERPGNYHIHDLVWLYARERTTAEDGEAECRSAVNMFLDGYLEISRQAVFVATRREAAISRQGIFITSANALEWLEAEKDTLIEAVMLADAYEEPGKAWKQTFVLAPFFHLRRYVDEWMTTVDVARACAVKVGDRQAESLALNSLGLAYQELGWTEEAVENYLRALDLLPREGDRHEEGQIRGNLANAYQTLRQFDEAINCYRLTLKIFREIGARDDEAATLNNLGVAYREIQMLDESLDCHRKSLAIRRLLGDRIGEGATLNNLGATYSILGRLDESVECYRQDVAIRRESGDGPGLGITLGSLGSVYLELRRYSEAVHCYKESLAIYQAIGDSYGEEQVTINLARVSEERASSLAEPRAAPTPRASSAAGVVRWAVRHALARRTGRDNGIPDEMSSGDRERLVAIAVAHESRELERFLHDTVLSTLTALAQEQADTRCDDLIGRCLQDVEMLGQWADTVHLSIAAPREARVDLLAEIHSVVTDMHAAGLAVHLRGTGGNGSLSAVPEVVTRAVSGAVREALGNAFRHAGSGEAWVNFHIRQDPRSSGHLSGFEVTVRDKGAGFDPVHIGPGSLGIQRSIIERLSDAGGQASVKSAPGAGTEVTLRWRNGGRSAAPADPSRPGLDAMGERHVIPAGRQQRESLLAFLETGALPLLRKIADGTLDPTDESVQRSSARQAAALRRLLADGIDRRRSERTLPAALEPVIREAEHHGLDIATQIVEDPGPVPEPIVTATCAAVGAVLRSQPPQRARLTVFVGEEVELFLSFGTSPRQLPDVSEIARALPAALSWSAETTTYDTGWGLEIRWPITKS